MINHTGWLYDRILSSQPKSLRMPLLCALNKSLAAPILSEGWNEITRGLNTHYYQLNKNETYLTSIASTGNTMIAMGSGNPSGDLYFIKENAIGKENETSSCRFHEIYHTQLQRPVYSLDWSQHHLLVGSNKGITQLYSTHQLDLDGQPQDQLEILGEYQSQHIPKSFCAPPGKCASNSHVKSVLFNPTYSAHSPSNENEDNNSLGRSTHFLTTAASHVELWDVNYPGNANLQAVEPDESPTNVACWSSLSPSLIVAGGETGHLYVADLRVKNHQGIVWKASEAHSNAIRDAQFNPFIPFWLASGGDDSIVNIWDLRATCHKPLAKIDGHHGPITSISWGNVRPEKLATASRDGTFRMWSLSGSTIPIWDSCNQLMDCDSYRKSDLPQLEENWWPDIIDSEIHSMDANFGISDGDIVSSENGKIVPISAFGIGEWGKLEIGPLYYGDLHKHSKGSVVEVLVSKNRPGLFYCATSSGQLCSQIFRPTTRGALDYPHRYDCNKDPLCYTIDNAIHYRHINVANNLIKNLKEISMEDNEQKRIRDDLVKDFEDCLRLQPPIQANDWTFDCIPAQDSKRLWTDADMWQHALDIFRKDLAYWRTHLAPGCETIFGDIPLDTGDLYPHLSSKLMKGTDFKLNKSNPIFPWEQASPPPSPSFYDSSARKSQADAETAPKPKTKKSLRRSSTTPNMTSDDLLATYTDLKNLNERNSSGTVLNTGANWKPLQRAKTSATPKQSKQITRQPSLSPSTIRSIFTKSNKRQETPLKQQNRSPVRQESPLSQQEGLIIGQRRQQKQQEESPIRQKTPVSLKDETRSGQETPLSQQSTPIIQQESSPSQQTTTAFAQKETQKEPNLNPFVQQNTSSSQKDKSPSQSKKEQHPPLPQQQNILPGRREKQQPQPPQKMSPIQHEKPIYQPEKPPLGSTNDDDQHLNSNYGDNINVSPPQQMDIKSIIKFGSFRHPVTQQGASQSIGMSASTNNLSTSVNTTTNPFTRGMSSETSLPNMTSTTTDTRNNNNKSPIRLSDNNGAPANSSELGNGGGSTQRHTTNKTDNDDTDHSNISRQHSTILAPAKSLHRAFTKKLRRKKTRSSSSSSVSSYNPADRDPQHHRQQPQADVSRPSSRNAL